MVEQFTTILAAALAQSLWEVGKRLAKEGVLDATLEPVAERIKGFVQRGYRAAEKDKAMQKAVKTAFAAIGAPEDEEGMTRYALNLGFDQFQAENNVALREELARAALLLTDPDPDLIPDDLFADIRWPSDKRQLLADFLFALRQELEVGDAWGPLIKAANERQVRDYLRSMRADVARTADATEHIQRYLRVSLESRGLDPDKSDAQAYEDYIKYIQRAHSRINFLFVRPADRRRQLAREAELETVFVPLQVEDPEVRRKQRDLSSRVPQEELEREREKVEPVTINDVLARYDVFLLKGNPGSGKTTLLRHVALCFARGQAQTELKWDGPPLLPVLVPLRNFGRFLKNDGYNPGPRAMRAFIEGYFADQDLGLPPDFFRRRLHEGNCLVLLDGLDEVADPNLRATVAQMVSAFVRHYVAHGNRFGLASRPRGYEEVADYLHDPAPVICDVQPLTPESRDRLVSNLLDQLESNARQRQQELPELLQDIRAKERVDELSRNPLFCTTLVLVYKYRGTTLPERRVDVYHELVQLMLGFWDVQRAAREGIAAAHELARMDGTGRVFHDDDHAIEAKQRALTHLADWMQRNELAEVPKGEAEEELARFFHEFEGAAQDEKDRWAERFLDVAHQRSGLFVEVDPQTYAFSHQNFREYLAATALIGQLDDKMVRTVLEHADDAWWREVILLAAAYPPPGLSPQRRALLLKRLMDEGHLLLAGRCAVDAGDRVAVPLQRQIQERLHAQVVEASLTPKERYEAGEALDELGWLPPDLNAWVRCPGCAEDGRDLMAARYPVTNAQYALFVAARGYENPAYWGGEETNAWRWRLESWRGSDVKEPQYWHHPRFGRERAGYPVVGVSWYEANAYAAWLSDLLQRAQEGGEGLKAEERELVEGLLAAGVVEVRLPTEVEWEKMAGGSAGGRYPWNPQESAATAGEEAILARANVEESGIGGPSPVAMYPLGASRPFGLMDLAGNVWEWTATWDEPFYVLRGGAFYNELEQVTVGARGGYDPDVSGSYLGFRLVSPVVSGS